MAEYKDSLNLPHSDFPMKANLAQREPERIQQWEAAEIYKAVCEQNADNKKFVLHDGPPYANGHLHCGHALNKILKDMIVKSKALSGYKAEFVPGWDCHGLPIELNVEKKIGPAGAKVTAAEFRRHCREYASSQIAIQKQEFRRLGVFADWDNPYITMNYQYEANIVRALAKIMENGHLQQGFKPVHWCINCGSALAEAEVDYEDKLSDSIDVAFLAETPELLLKAFSAKSSPKPVIVPIWTTTPWTLPANEAVALHPSIEYSLVETESCFYVLATELVECTMAKYGLSTYSLKAALPGKALEGLKLQHPFYARQVPLVLAEHVSTDAGTGAVHTAPAHGPDDYQVGLRYQLPLLNPVLANGCYIADLELFAGRSVLKVNQEIIELLQAKGVLLKAEKMQHSYPHCWRHKTAVIFRATPQWFIAMDKNGLREKMLAVIEEVNWVPDWGKARIRLMIEGRPDWCISRQRAWGTPIPLFLHKETGEPHPDSLALMEKVAQIIEQSGIEGWFALDTESLLGADAEFYSKGQDTLDVWFDSGVSHFAVLQQGHQLGLPADIYLEGSDQHRGWFNSSLTTAVAMYGKAPYRSVLTHGYTVDAEGKKLSKSKGNYVDLDKLVNQHGADILRLWVSSTDYRHEVSISDEIIKRTADAYRRIRNTGRFLLANLFDFDPKQHLVTVDDMLSLDRYILEETQRLQTEILSAYESYQFHLIYQKIHNFCAVDLGSFYLDIIKDRQYTSAKEGLARRSCQTAMYHIIQALSRWLAPILSFTAEELWQYLPGEKSCSIFLAGWYQAWPKISKSEAEFWLQIRAVREEANKALEMQRANGLIGSALEAKVSLFAEPALYQQLLTLAQELRFVLICSQVELHPLSDRTDSDLYIDTLGLAIRVTALTDEKCARCWHRLPEVGSLEAHPELCGRCASTLEGGSEARAFA